MPYGPYRRNKSNSTASTRIRFEGCGLLLGQHSEAGNVVVAIRPMQNVWPVEAEKPERFRIDEKAWLSAELDAMQNDSTSSAFFTATPITRLSRHHVIWRGHRGPAIRT